MVTPVTFSGERNPVAIEIQWREKSVTGRDYRSIKQSLQRKVSLALSFFSQ